MRLMICFQSASRKLATHAPLHGEPQIEHLQDRFAPSTTDDVWLDALRKEGAWIVCTFDGAMRKDHSTTVAACRTAGIVLVFFAHDMKQLKLIQQHLKVVAGFRDGIETLRKAAAGSTFEMTVGGKLKPLK